MNKTILFSPVGGTDPMSSTNLRDGSLLHICRVMKPDIVILYMSYEMLKNEEEDHRYTYCLDHLKELQNREFEYYIIERPALKEVQEFDFFYQDFRIIMEKIYQEKDDSDQLLLNISSGTPAMKSGLLVLKTLGEFPCRAIQVSTPIRMINEHVHKGYDVETAWELNEDNQENFENRCTEVHCPTLSAIKTEELIKRHIAVYDYQAAVTIGSTLDQSYTEKYLPLLEMAEYRLRLDFKHTDERMKKTGCDCIPVKDGNARKYFEYMLSLDIKLRKKEYADFIRAITPLIVDLFEMVLKKQFHFDLSQYCFSTEEGLRWDKNKISNTEILDILNKNYMGAFKAGNVYSDHLRTLIVHFSEDVRLTETVNDLRDVEKKIRNLAAHQIVSIDDEKIKAMTGFSGVQTYNKIKTLFSYTGMNIKKEYWNSYDEMNEMIMAQMEHHEI